MRGSLTSDELPFSVIVCTARPAHYLQRCLEALLGMEYANFEVVVVTQCASSALNDLLARYKVKHIHSGQRNLSADRNLGIRVSAGKLLAFIDDDAVPDKHWLKELAASYKDDLVGGVGGKVFYWNTDREQFANGVIDMWGYFQSVLEQPGNRNNAHGPLFNTVMGTNCSFRKETLCKLGGFDEFYDYFLDEGDLALRVIRSGMKIVHQPKAVVYHEFASSSDRKTVMDRDWFPVVKNNVYFGIKNTEGIVSSLSRLVTPLLRARKWLREFYNWYTAGNIALIQFLRLTTVWFKGVFRGYDNAMLHERRLRHDLHDPSTTMLKFEIEGQPNSICLLSQTYPPSPCGGIGIYTYVLARELVSLGKKVHVITRGTTNRDYVQDGVQVHVVCSDPHDWSELSALPLIQDKMSHTYAVYKKLLELVRQVPVDIVESPLWDIEGLAICVAGLRPLVVRLETPLRKVIETNEWTVTKELELLSQLERTFVETSDGVISISRSLRDDFQRLYEPNLRDKVDDVIPIGTPVPDATLTPSKNQIVLFAGRFEKRKGIDTLVKAIPLVLKAKPSVEFWLVSGEDAKTGSIQFYRNELERTLPSELWNNVRLFEGVSHEQLSAYYAACSLFVGPSKYESFGIVYIEAMAWGKPVIACRVGGVPEVVQDGITGYLVAPNSPEQLATTVLQLLNCPERLATMGRNARVLVEHEFSSSKMAKRSLAFYTQVLTSKELGRVNLTKHVSKTGDWTEREVDKFPNSCWLMSSSENSCLEGTFRGSRLEITFLKHRWSGLAVIEIDELRYDVNLYAEDINPSYIFSSDRLTDGDHRFRIEVTGQKDERSRATEIWVNSITAIQIRN